MLTPMPGRAALVALALVAILSSMASAGSVDSDGGITLWISYDNSDTAGLDIDTVIDLVDSTAGASCTATNNARSAQGAPNSPGSCPGATCTGRDKLTGDIERFAQYVYQSTQGAHYIRRVYVSDEGRSWDSADIRWNMNTAGSFASVGGWKTVGSYLTLQSAERKCIHDVLHHEFGHYFHALPDRYRSDESNGYYRGRIGTGTVFDVGVEVADPNTVMNSNFPHLFVDTTNASITIEYDPPGTTDVNFPPGEVLTPNLLTDADTTNDGPNRAHHGFTNPFAEDEWAVMPDEHADLAGIHTEGDFSIPDLASMPAVDVRFIGDDDPPPGAVLLLDRSGSMGVLTDGIPASQFVQEAGLYLYHSSQPTDYVGTYLYNQSVEELFPYAVYDPTNTLPMASFKTAQGLTDIAEALETGIDALIAEHGEGGANGGHIFLMSDGKQTTGASLWDQVTRANNLGIQIHTMAFGDADVPTMEAIATSTSGSITEVSERDDADELKLGMARKFTTIRGFKPIYSFKGQLLEIGFMRKQEIHEAKFVVPPKSRNMLFYAFVEDGNAANYDIELIDPSGHSIHRSADNLAVRGRFNGLRVPRPEPGLWRYRILGSQRSDGQLPRDAVFELTAYVENPQIGADVQLADRVTTLPGAWKIEASSTYRYPLTDVDVRAYLYAHGDLLGWVPLFDDGKNGLDSHAGDGVYSGILDVRRMDLDFGDDRRSGTKARIDVRFTVGSHSKPAPNAHYESGTIYDNLSVDFQKNARIDLEFTIWATSYVTFGEPAPTHPQLRLIEPRKQVLVRPGSKGSLTFMILNARPIESQLRVSLGHGVRSKFIGVRDTEDGSPGGVYQMDFEVSTEAQPGPRDLKVQFGPTIREAPCVLFVSG